jgi:hypothetical protein
MKSQSTKYRALTTCVATILLAGMIPSIAAAAAPTVTHYRFSGLTADLCFADTSGSVETDGCVSATQGQGQNPSTLFVYYAEEYDFLSNNYSCYSGTVPLTTSQLQIGNSLDSASLDVTGAVLQDCFTGNSVTADISLTWTGSGGPPSGYNSTYRFTQGVFVVRDRSSGLSRAATATGTLVINGTNFLAGVPIPDFTYADLAKASFSEVDIMKRPF